MGDWANIIIAGGGRGEWRVEIEGWPYQPVTSEAMEGTLATVSGEDYTGVQRVAGLQVPDTELSEDLSLVEARLEVSGLTVEIVDKDETWTAAFTTNPAVNEWLTASSTAADTTFDITAFDSFGDYAHIGTEVVEIVTAVSSPITVARGVWGTTAQAHNVGTGENLTYPEVTDVPVLMRRRWLKLWFHGPNELGTTAEGTLVWKAIIAEEPRYQGATWQIVAKPITEQLNTDLMAAFDGPVDLHGIYYAWDAPLQIELREWDNDDVVSGSLNLTEVITISGFYKNQGDFVDAVQAAMDGTSAAWDGSWFCEEDPDWGWIIGFRTGTGTGSAGYWCDVKVRSLVDGEVDPGRVWKADGTEVLNTEGVAQNTDYRFLWEDVFLNGRINRVKPYLNHEAARQKAVDAGEDRVGDVASGVVGRQVPRASYEWDTAGDVLADLVYSASAPSNRIYLDKAAHMQTGDDLVCLGLVLGTISATDATDGYVEIQDPETNNPIDVGAVWIGDYGPQIEVSRKLMTEMWGDLDDFRTKLEAKALTGANDGSVPYVQCLASWATPVAAVKAGNPYLQNRAYVFSKKTSLAELLEHEWRLHGLLPYLDANFDIALRELRAPTQVDATSATIAEADHMDWATVEINPDNVVNVVELFTGWNGSEHVGRTLRYRNVSSISRIHQRRTQEIKPLVRSNPDPGWEDYLARAKTTLGLFGSRWIVIEVPVPFTLFGTLVGDYVNVTSPHIPFNGVRGITARVGMVIGRRWNPAQGYGFLRVFLLSDLDVRGYSPSLRITSWSNVSGDQWDLSATAAFSEGGTSATDRSYFAVGDRINVAHWNDATPTVARATVDDPSSGGNNIRVTFDSAWTPGSPAPTTPGNEWRVSAIDADAATGPTATQQAYAFVAGTDRRVDSSGMAHRMG